MGTTDTENQTYTYKVCEKNKLPFKWKCPICGTITEILGYTSGNKQCSNDKCPYELIFTGLVV